MFTLDAEEFGALRSQFATSNDQASTSGPGRGGRRYAPRVFTEHGALMAATILNSPRAVEVSVYVARAFVASHAELAKRLDELEQKSEALAMSHETFSRNTRAQLKQVFDALCALMAPPDPPKRPIGFVHSDDKSSKKTSRARSKT
jgi:hypothetical protein